jgi:copper chaperone CopZ
MLTPTIRKAFFLVLLCSFFIQAQAQINEVQIGVDGLTCSQCTRSVEMQIRKLDFVKDVKMNLEHTEGVITFKPNHRVDVDQIAKAVVNAGFSVRYLQAAILFSNVNVSDGHCFADAGYNYEFIQTKPQTLNGTVMVKFIGDKFVPKKDLKKWQPYLKNSCGAGADNKVHYITI